MSDKLLKVIEDLQSDKSLDSLSEADISLGVVLRILDALSWSTYDRREVSPEYSVENRWVDYALLISNAPQVFIEVKKGGEPLEKHQEQLLDYAFRQGVKVAILTNGATWWFYLPLREVSWEQRKFATVELDKQSKVEIVQRLADLLGKENVRSGQAVQNAEVLYEKRQMAAILPEAWNQLVSEPDGLIVARLAEKTGELCGHEPDENQVEQFMSAHLQNIKITQPPIDRKPIPPPNPKPPDSMKGKKPTAFTLNGTRYEVTSWIGMLVRLCQVVHSDRGNRFEEVLSSKIFNRGKRPDFSRNKDDFISAQKINGTDIFVNKNKNADRIKQIAENLIAHFGYDKNAFYIEAQ